MLVRDMNFYKQSIKLKCFHATSHWNLYLGRVAIKIQTYWWNKWNSTIQTLNKKCLSKLTIENIDWRVLPPVQKIKYNQIEKIYELLQKTFFFKLNSENFYMWSKIKDSKAIEGLKLFAKTLSPSITFRIILD